MGQRVGSTATITLPKRLAAALALFCAEHHEQPADVVADALALHLDELGQHFEVRPQDFGSLGHPPGETWPSPVPGCDPGEATRAPPASTPRRLRTRRAAEEVVPALRAPGPAPAACGPPPPDQLELLPAARS